MGQPVVTPPPRERRQRQRRVLEGNEPLVRVRLRTGRDVVMLDVADAGALVEGTARLLPGTHVDAHVTTAAGRVLVRCRVVRAWVSEVQPGSVTYRTALAFQQPVETSGVYRIPDRTLVPGGTEGIDYPDPGPRARAFDVRTISA
jgi:hypothetical protein